MSSPLREGKIYIENDFYANYADVVWGAGTLVSGAFSPFGFTSVNEGSFANTIDEPGGILAITQDTGDDDNAFLIAGTFFARDGGCSMGARFKYNNVDCAAFVGFAETMSLTTPVVPCEFATATMTYAAGNVIGLNYDVDGTTDDWRAVCSDTTPVAGAATNGTRANATLTADRWVEAMVYIFPDGGGECWLSEIGHVDGDSIPQLRRIRRFDTRMGITGLDTTGAVYACLGQENRSANARILEVDYIWAEGNRDRRPT